MKAKRLISTFLCGILIICGAFAGAGCKKGGKPSDTPEIDVTVDKREITLNVYEQAVLSANVFGSEETVKWTSDNSSAIALTANGNECSVSALAAGTVNVTAACGEASATCVITVEDWGYIPNLELTNLAENSDGLYELNLIKGGTFEVETALNFNGKDVTDYTLKYETEGKNVVSVTDGVINAVSDGTENVTVSATWRGNEFPSAVKTVKVDVAKGALVLSQYNIDLEYDSFVSGGGNNKTFAISGLNAKIYLDGNVQDNAAFTLNKINQSTASEILVISSDSITATGGGEGVVRLAAVYQNGDTTLKSAQISVNVTHKRGEVTSANAKAQLISGCSQTASGSAYSSSATVGSITVKDYNGNPVTDTTGRLGNYVSTDESIATVDGNGAITPVGKAGVCTVGVMFDNALYPVTYVTVKDFSGYKAIVNVDDLNAVATGAAGKYVLANDIDLDGRMGSIASAFSGTFDGNGYTLSNGVLSSHKIDEDNSVMTFFNGDFSGVLRNVVFKGWNITEGHNNSWSACTMVGLIKGGAVIENVYIDMTVEGTGANINCNGILTGNAWDTSAVIRNVLINATYDYANENTYFDTKIATVGGTHSLNYSDTFMKDVYAIVNGGYKDIIPSNYNTTPAYDLNYSSLEELMTLKPEPFAEGGAFTTEFWQNVLSQL